MPHISFWWMKRVFSWIVLNQFTENISCFVLALFIILYFVMHSIRITLIFHAVKIELPTNFLKPIAVADKIFTIVLQIYFKSDMLYSAFQETIITIEILYCLHWYWFVFVLSVIVIVFTFLTIIWLLHWHCDIKITKK